MAVNIGTTPERWLRGVDRVVAGVAELLPSLPARPWRGATVPARWVMERGAVRAAAPVDALGGFPGSLRSRNLLERTTVIATSRYLVVGEGTSYGFVLKLDDLRSVSMVRPSPRANPGLVFHFQDGPAVGTFALNFRGLARGLSGRYRAEDLLRVLEEQGVQRLTPHQIAGIPSLVLSWEDARVHAPEALLWAGMARACVGGWYGAVQRSCRVWLTGTSLFWCSPREQGVNRLTLSEILEARDGIADRVCISFRDDGGQRYDLPFDFNVDARGTTGMQERVRFLNALASCGVPVGTATMAATPWRRGGTVRPDNKWR